LCVSEQYADAVDLVTDVEESKPEPPVSVKLPALATMNSQKILDQLLDMSLDDEDNRGEGAFMATKSSTSPISKSSLSSRQNRLLDDLLIIPESYNIAVDSQAVESDTTYEAIYDKEKDDSHEALTINPTASYLDDGSSGLV